MADTDAGVPMPPATFEFLVESFVFQTQLSLGLLRFGAEKPEVDLQRARHSIDLLAMLQEKTRGNLSLDEQRMLENSLTELRFRYVQAVEDAAKAPPPAAPEDTAEAAQS